MIFMNGLRIMSVDARTHWNDLSPLHAGLCSAFLDITRDSATLQSSMLYDAGRDRFRDALSIASPTLFPRRGAVGTYASAVIERLTAGHDRGFKVFVACTPHFAASRSAEQRAPIEMQLPDLIMPETAGSRFTIQSWLSNFIRVEARNACKSIPVVCPVSQCQKNEMFSFEFVSQPPRFLTFEALPGTNVNVSFEVAIPGSSYLYNVIGIVYHGSNHFAARFFHAGEVFDYDGRVNGGYPVARVRDDNLRLYDALDGRRAHIYIYMLSDDGGN